MKQLALIIAILFVGMTTLAQNDIATYSDTIANRKNTKGKVLLGYKWKNPKNKSEKFRTVIYKDSLPKIDDIKRFSNGTPVKIPKKYFGKKYWILTTQHSLEGDIADESIVGNDDIALIPVKKRNLRKVKFRKIVPSTRPPNIGDSIFFSFISSLGGDSWKIREVRGVQFDMPESFKDSIEHHIRDSLEVFLKIESGEIQTDSTHLVDQMIMYLKNAYAQQRRVFFNAQTLGTLIEDISAFEYLQFKERYTFSTSVPEEVLEIIPGASGSAVFNKEKEIICVIAYYKILYGKHLVGFVPIEKLPWPKK